MRGYQLILFGVVTFMLLTGCTTSRQNKDAITLSETLKTASSNPSFFKADRKISFEDKDIFILVEGSQCTEQPHGNSPATMLITHDMPAYVNNGTIILNGWSLRYLNGDRQVRSLRADILHSKLVTGGNRPPTLVFEVEGELGDQNRNDAYEFCIYYTGLGYNSASIDARIEGDYNGIESQTLQVDSAGPIATLESHWQDGTLKSSDSIAVLPRGFDFQYENEFECELRMPPCRWEDPTDHHLRQIAYSLFQVDASPNPNNYPHWITQTIFKDDSIHTHWVKTRTALIGGNSIKLRTNVLPLNPRAGKTNICRNGVGGTVDTSTFTINELPFDYAIPILTGWNLDYECSDQNVQRAGIWIHDIRFNPANSTLEYKLSSILRDKDGAPGFNTAHRISVLGFNRLSIPSVVEQAHPELKIRIRKPVDSYDTYLPDDDTNVLY